MTTYTADDFKRARFAEHPSGGVACKAGDDQPWIHPSLESDREFFLVDEIMAERGWAPVPAGSYTRTDEPDDMDGGVTAALIEKEAEQRACPDLDAHWRLDEAQETIQRLTQERDEARADLAEYVQAQALRTQPHPLTPDAITADAYERGVPVLRAAPQKPSVMVAHETVRAIVTAVLTEPPARPEGAAEIEALLWNGSEDDEMTVLDAEDRRLISNYLASRGVRVVTEEQP